MASMWQTSECLEIVQSIMRCRDDLECRRRVAAFVCSSDFIGEAGDAVAVLEEQEEEGQEEQQAVEQHGVEELLGTAAPPNASLADNLTSFLSGFDLRATLDPEQALRKLLLEFPFLPIDAGEGADRVLKTVAVIYLAQHPEQVRARTHPPPPVARVCPARPAPCAHGGSVAPPPRPPPNSSPAPTPRRRATSARTFRRGARRPSTTTQRVWSTS